MTDLPYPAPEMPAPASEPTLSASWDAATDECLRAYVAAARATWPDLGVSDADFIRHVAERVPPHKLSMTANAADLLLACACALGDGRAIGAFERTYGSVITRVLKRRGAAPDVVGDAAQAIRQRLLVAEPSRLPAIADYKGAGALKSWVSATAATTLRMLHRSNERRREQALESELTELTGAQNPEAMYMKLRYKRALEGSLMHALSRLEVRKRTLLRLHLGGRLDLAGLGTMYGVSRATIARWLASTRLELAEATRQEARARYGLSDSAFASLAVLLRSQLEVSVLAHLDSGSA